MILKGSWCHWKTSLIIVKASFEWCSREGRHDETDEDSKQSFVVVKIWKNFNDQFGWQGQWGRTPKDDDVVVPVSSDNGVWIAWWLYLGGCCGVEGQWMILPVWWRVLLGGIKGEILRREAHIATYFIWYLWDSQVKSNTTGSDLDQTWIIWYH